MGRYSSVDRATHYGLDSPWIGSRWRKRFSAPTQIGPGAHPASYTKGNETLPRIKRPERGADHRALPSAKVKEGVELYLYFPSGSSWPALGWTLPLPLHLPPCLRPVTIYHVNIMTFDWLNRSVVLRFGFDPRTLWIISFSRRLFQHQFLFTICGLSSCFGYKRKALPPPDQSLIIFYITTGSRIAEICTFDIYSCDTFGFHVIFKGSIFGDEKGLILLYKGKFDNKEFLCSTHTVEHNCISPSSTVGIQLHFSPVLLGEI